jgi:hypothetical protein
MNECVQFFMLRYMLSVLIYIYPNIDNIGIMVDEKSFVSARFKIF